MFSTRFKEKYTITFSAIQRELDQPQELVDAQRLFLAHLTDEIPIPKTLEQLVSNTEITMSTLRDAVRYAQDRCAEVVIAVTEQDIECERLGMPEFYGERFIFYRGIIEDGGGRMPRGKHIGDEAWLQCANPQELVTEAAECVNERYYMEGVWANMDKFVKGYLAIKMRREKGLMVVITKEDKERMEAEAREERALVKNGESATKGGRLGHTARGGRGGGAVGRSDGSFRGFK